MKLAAIHVYPVKSLAGLSLDESVVEPWGLRHDRRWVVLAPDGTRLSAREEHRMLGLTAVPVDGAIKLSSREGDTIRVDLPLDGEVVLTAISRLESAHLAGPAAHAWLSRHLGRDVRLAWLDDPHRRSVSDQHGGVPGDSLTFADAGPLLLTTTTSLAQLNEWIGDDLMEMARFRPNLVVDEVPVAFEEDAWRTVRIGDAEFRFAEVCDRCVLTTLDPHTLLGGKEPLRTLAKYRQWEHKTWFGIRLIPSSLGTISVGDPVEVVSAASASA